MSQEKEWEREYVTSKLLTKDNKPQNDVVRFAKYLKKEEKIGIEGKQVIDLGSGTGRNSFYFAELGANVTGMEISKTAIKIGKENIQAYKNESDSHTKLDIIYIHQSIGEEFPFFGESFDIALDITSSNSLLTSEREMYLSETCRVLKKEGYFFVKALCKDGDDNAKYLLRDSPGPEADTYVLPELGIVERVWTKTDFISYYSKYFTILYFEKKMSYPRMNKRSYKRNFFIAYLKKN